MTAYIQTLSLGVKLRTMRSLFHNNKIWRNLMVNHLKKVFNRKKTIYLYLNFLKSSDLRNDQLFINLICQKLKKLRLGYETVRQVTKERYKVTE